MSKVSNKNKYPAVTDPNEGDFLLGTLAAGLGTGTFSLGALALFVARHLNAVSKTDEATFVDFVLGLKSNGETIKIPVTDFTGALVGNLEGNYTEFAPEDDINQENYL